MISMKTSEMSYQNWSFLYPKKLRYALILFCCLVHQTYRLRRDGIRPGCVRGPTCAKQGSDTWNSSERCVYGISDEMQQARLTPEKLIIKTLMTY